MGALINGPSPVMRVIAMPAYLHPRTVLRPCHHARPRRPHRRSSGCLTAKEIYEATQNLVFQIRVVDVASGDKYSIGSGFLVSDDGYLATNFHVVASFVYEPPQVPLGVRATGRRYGCSQPARNRRGERPGASGHWEILRQNFCRPGYDTYLQGRPHLFDGQPPRPRNDDHRGHIQWTGGRIAPPKNTVSRVL